MRTCGGALVDVREAEELGEIVALAPTPALQELLQTAQEDAVSFIHRVFDTTPVVDKGGLALVIEGPVMRSKPRRQVGV